MSTEPERNIEKQLKAYADKRRAEAGAPFGLHQATRKMLQAEVAKNMPKSPRHGNFTLQMLARLWPRVALGASIVAVLTVGTWMFFQAQQESNKPFELAQAVPGVRSADENAAKAVTPIAQNKSRIDLSTTNSDDLTRLASAAGEKAFAARPAGQGVDSEKSRSDPFGEKYALKSPPAAASQLADGKKAQSLDRASEQLSLKPSVAPAETETAAGRSHASRSTPTSAGSPVSQQAPKPAASPAPAVSSGKEIDRWHIAALRAGYSTQLFSQVGALGNNRLAAENSGTNTVLTSFQMEQAGDRVRVIDKDGSAYAGYVQKSDTTPRQQSADAKDLAPNRERKTKMVAKVQVFPTGIKSEVEAEQDYFFRVVGTNHSLNQNVVFSGHLLANTSNADYWKTNVNATTTGQLQPPAQNQTVPPLFNFHINGTALIGESNTVEIQAVPVAP